MVVELLGPAVEEDDAIAAAVEADVAERAGGAAAGGADHVAHDECCLSHCHSRRATLTTWRQTTLHQGA